ncbi:uncharacterized protein [Ptychodera flava]|uniref:uncharacterized protein n=1 Tax=Ptychodera flava TaxID=63121 RepID=UPI00396A82FF
MYVLRDVLLKDVCFNVLQLYSETVLYALEFLVNITRRAPILQKVQSLGNALLKYSSSGDAKVAKVAQLLKTLVSLSGDGKSQLNINVPLPGQLLTSEQQQDRDIAIADFLARNLALIVTKKHFCDIVMTDKYLKDWNDVAFTIDAMGKFAVDNIIFVNELFAKRIISTIQMILSMEQLYTMQSENQRWAWLTEKLLDLLIQISERKSFGGI